MAAAVSERDQVIGMITGAWKTQVIGEGVKLGLFERIGDGTTSADALAQATGANPDGVMRLLRGLATLGLLRHEPGNRFTLTSLGQYLRRDAADSLNGMTGHWSDRMWYSFAGIGESIRTGEASAPSGIDHFAQQQADVASADVFNRAMAEGSLRVGRALAQVYDFSDCRTLMDAGGGYGALLVGPLEANPQLKGQVYDLPTLSGVALRYLDEQGVGGRVDYLGGSFFESVPAGADCIMLKFILHDWNDANSLTILRNCAKVIGDGRILVIERIVPETVSEVDQDVIRGDLTMLTVGGKERTEAEYHALLSEAGLTITKIVEIDAAYSAIEARVG
ncbi:methyltransferase [Sphingobium nicotianae]|uniref:Methyltransferase n=1 Tax=Sphingobium nicotianae TaxID=2782607 RepID=A0A9X1D9D2_9SPHN|nr:methyltransferase [Sphingobium nicotianae]MBT2185673.1 hypothetical protein [Sphingobium nicotianae]